MQKLRQFLIIGKVGLEKSFIHQVAYCVFWMLQPLVINKYVEYNIYIYNIYILYSPTVLNCILYFGSRKVWFLIPWLLWSWRSFCCQRCKTFSLKGIRPEKEPLHQPCSNHILSHQFNQEKNPMDFAAIKCCFSPISGKKQISLILSSFQPPLQNKWWKKTYCISVSSNFGYPILHTLNPMGNFSLDSEILKITSQLLKTQSTATYYVSSKKRSGASTSGRTHITGLMRFKNLKLPPQQGLKGICSETTGFVGVFVFFLVSVLGKSNGMKPRFSEKFLLATWHLPRFLCAKVFL